jgi:hypothetical protein
MPTSSQIARLLTAIPYNRYLVPTVEDLEAVKKLSLEHPFTVEEVQKVMPF